MVTNQLFCEQSFLIFFQFVSQFTVEWINHLEIIINLINNIINDFVKVVITAQIIEKIFLCSTTKHLYGIINSYF